MSRFVVLLALCVVLVLLSFELGVAMGQKCGGGCAPPAAAPATGAALTDRR